jgi:hypothetical protein
VGPMTVTMLLHNTLRSAELAVGRLSKQRSRSKENAPA